ncbi:MAG: nickel pincer cofactor biosynthesis protein LarB [Actinomycetia bacterium]|nr:nickel pincer cofactor biosynthesis protein LarB [Actinomycetes bacterium]
MSATNNAQYSPSLAEFANLDFERSERCGWPEVVFGQGKTPEQIAAILTTLSERNEVVLCTRASAEAAAAVQAVLPQANYVSACHLLFVDRRSAELRLSGQSTAEILKAGRGQGQVLVCCAGTTDLPVAEEAALTAALMGSRVQLLADIGIAGLHRSLAHLTELRAARVIVAVAGMEGALPSLLAGLVEVPVVAVPTSVGYGANFGGLAALLGMLNSCANGVSVVNIDNGFGAGVIAHRINQPAWAD